MPSILLSVPAVEPVTLDEARSFLRVEHNDDDEVIAALVAGSRIHVEAQTKRALITQSWRVTADSWPQDGRLTVLPAPLQALTAARVYDLDGNAQDVNLQAFVPDLGASVLAFAPWALPAPGRSAMAISDRETFRASLNYLLRYPQETRLEIVQDYQYRASRYRIPAIYSPRIGTTTTGWSRAAPAARCCRRP